ncbi:hypothetical protein OSB04_015694 [Centaurea solstitialis]|uniref:F-box domain-containing protein n=1 Tax=Centaurea solstitialis TaxID=347529 RepID=A0AA38T156_9ASTR|nr:hypothetical protein OSB04_015694 [Centaurea solstitialis]
MDDFFPHLRLRLIHSSMEELPAELTIDILSRLPVKTIIRCKIVCKKWWNLVNDSSFVNLHLSKSHPTGLVIHRRKDYKDPGILEWVEIEDKVDHHHLHYHRPFIVDLKYNLAPVLPKSGISHLGSVNGLICLQLCYQTLNLYDTYICNPITREYMILHRQHFFRGDDFGVVLYGFGVSSLTGEYKVVRAFQGKILPKADKPSWMNVLEAEVYTLGTCQWRSLGPILVTYRINTFHQISGPFLNNNCHWIVSDNQICTVDLDKETFQYFHLLLPHVLAILKGCLCKLETYNSHFSIWVMKEYGIKNSWHKEVMIRREICVDLGWPLAYKPIHPVAVLKDGSILIVFENKLCLFDPRSETIEDTKMFFDRNLSGLAYRPSFLKLQHFESERFHTFYRTLMDPSMEALPAELTMDILSRLPVKTIIHCKCVCKKWRNLVLDSSFANLHLSRSPPTGFVIHHEPRVPNDPGSLKWVEIEDKADHHHIYHDRLLTFDLNLLLILQKTRMLQVGSVNGLICLGRYSLKRNLDYTYICNPVTREYMLLPRQPSQTHGYGFLGVVYGLGVSSLTGEYKVVRAFQANKVVRYGDDKHTAQPSVLESEVYTLGTSHWRGLPPVPVTYWLNTSHPFYGPFLNNHCHWIVSDRKDPHDKIATFDLDKETFQLFPSPPESVQGKRCYGQSLSILKGCLCKLDTRLFELTIWVMKEYGIKNSWHKEVVITPKTTVDLKWPSYTPVVHLIAGLRDGSVLIVFENKLCVFDPRSQTIEDTKMFDSYYSSGWVYRPSFLKLQNFKSERVHMF